MQLPFVANRAGGKVAAERLKKRLAAAGRAFLRAVSPSAAPRFRRLSLESLEGRRVLACDSAFSFTRVTYDPAHPANVGAAIDAATPTNEGNSGTTVFRYLLRDSSYSVVGRDYSYSYAIDGFGSFSINTADLQPGLALDGTFTHGDLTSGNYLIDVIVQGDNMVEPNESFKVTLTGAAGDPITGNCSFELQSTISNDDSTSVIVNGSSSVAITEGGSGAVSLKLTNPVQGGLTVALTSSPGTATPVNDGYVVPASVTFTGNANEVRSATITTQQDNVVEPDETFTVAMGAVTTPAGISPTSVTATDHWDLQIKNDDSTTVSIGGVTVSEGGAAVFPITLTNPVFGGLRIDWQVVAGTAVATSDFSNSTSVQTIVIEGTSAEVTVNTVDDSVPELPEQFAVRLSNLRAVDTAIATSNFALAGGGASTSATGTITDDDFVPFEVSNPTATEGGDLTFDVKVLRAIGLPFTLDYAVGNGTASAVDADYTPVSGALSFSGIADETKTVTVVTGSDSKVEADETVLLNLINLNILFIFPYTIPLDGARQIAPGTGTIANDDTASLRVSDATSVVEGGTLSFTVALTGEVQGGFDLVYNTADGTGVDAATAADNDYNATPNGVFRFNGSSGETRTFTVPTRSDGKVEADEKVRFVMRSVQPLISAIDVDDITFSRSTAQGTITNDDTATLSIADAGHVDEGLSLDFVVTLSNDVQGGFGIAYATSDITASAAARDYTGTNAVLQFAGRAGEALTISIPTIEDQLVEADERLRLTLSTLTPGISLLDRNDITLTRSVAEGTIDNDDVFTVTIGNATTTEAGRSLTFPVTLGAGVQGGVAFDFSTADGTATVADGDYVARTGTLTFAGTPGETQNIVVTVNDDLRAEPDETLTTTIRNLRIGGAATTFTPQTGTGTITNDDRATLTIGDAQAVAEGGTLEFRVKLSADVTGGVTVNYTTADDTATVAGSDYGTVSGTLTFVGNRDETLVISVPTTGDSRVEADERLKVVLSNAAPVLAGVSPSILAITRDTAVGSIVNDDRATMTVGSPHAAEGAALSFSLTLSADVQGGVLVDYETVAGTATTTDPDFTARTGTATFAGTAGEVVNIAVSTIDDSRVESDETLQLAVRRVRLATTFADITTAVVPSVPGVGTIEDNDVASISIDDASIIEGGTLQFAVRLGAAVPGGVIVDYATADDTARVADSDYTSRTGSLLLAGTANELQTISVLTTADSNVESDERMTLTIIGVRPRDAGVSSGRVATANSSARGLIRNDDFAQLSIVGATVVEGNLLRFPVTLSRAVQGGLSVAYAASDGTATAADIDYSAAAGRLNFTGAAGEVQWVQVATRADLKVETDETLTVALSDIVANDATVAAGGITFTSSQATGTIRDDDSATITIGDAVVVEGGALRFPVDLNADVDGGVRLDFATTDGTATTVDGDYTPVRASLTFTTAGRMFVDVPTTSDSKVERDERLSLSLVAAAPGSPLISSARFTLPALPATGTITNDDGAVLSMSDSAVLEGGRLIFAITSSAAVDGGFYVDVTSFDGTARVADSDYAGGGATLLFTGIAGEVRNFIVNSTADTKVEANESLSVELGNVTPRSDEISAGTFELPTSPSIGTILNDDRARFTVADVRASEAGTLTFQVKLASAVDGGASVSFATADGTARTADGDYSGAAGSLSFTGLVGESRDVVVTLIDDNVVEADETISLALSNPLGAGPGLDASAFILPVTPATGTILSNDATVLTIAPASTQEGGPSAAGSLRFDVTLSKPVQGGLRVAYFTQDGAATVADNDYTPITLSQLTFAGTQGEVQTAVVNVTPDTRPEADETVRLALGAVTPLVAGVAPSSITASGSPAVGTIRDDDIIVSVRAATATVTENGAANLIYRFSRLGSTGSSLVVPFTVGGSAIYASDYAASGATSFSTTAGSVTFAVGQTDLDLVVDPTGDSTAEPDETVVLTISNSSSYTIGTNSAATGLITNDDLQVWIDGAPGAVVENSTGKLTYTFVRSSPLATALTMNFTVGGTASSASDYTQSGAVTFAGTTGSVRFAAGASIAVVTIAPRGDTTVESDETVVLTVVPPAGYVAGPTPSATGTILNDDTEVTVTVSPAAVSEDAGVGMVYLVQRRGLTTSDLDVAFTLTGTATSTSDYSVSGATMSSATAGSVRIPAGADSALVTVTPTADPTNESNETVIFTVGSGGGYLPGTAKTATGTINNDDPQATVVATTSSVYEGGTAKLVYTFSRTGSTALAVTLNFGVRGTATLGIDYTQTGAATYSSTAGSIRIPAGASSAQLLVTPVNDSVIETDETLTFDLRAGTGYFLPTTSISATGTILNEDGGGGGEGEEGSEGVAGSSNSGVDPVAAKIVQSEHSETRQAVAGVHVVDFVASVSMGGVRLSQGTSGNGQSPVGGMRGWVARGSGRYAVAGRAIDTSTRVGTGGSRLAPDSVDSLFGSAEWNG